MSSHMKFAASAAHRWMHCPGSYRLMKLAPFTPGGPAARLGTAVHAMIEEQIRSKDFNARAFEGMVVDLTTGGNARGIIHQDEKHSNGYMIDVTEKMIQDAQICLDLVSAIMDKRPNAFVYTEIRSEVMPGELGGTSDIVIVDNDWGAVIDYKNGRMHVEVEKNEQLQIYACGVSKLYPSVKNWTLAIVQPNDQEGGAPVRTWKTTTADLGKFRGNAGVAIELCKKAYNDHENPNWYNPGDQCRWCPGEGKCVAQRKLALTALGSDLPDLPGPDCEVKPVPVAELTNAQIAWVLKYRKMITAWLNDSVSKEGVKRVQEGQKIPGYKLVESRKHNKVTDPDALIEAADENEWDIWEAKVVGITELKKRIPKAEFSKFVSKPKGDPELAPETDKRPALDLATLTDGMGEL